jgi:hypothetical protein
MLEETVQGKKLDKMKSEDDKEMWCKRTKEHKSMTMDPRDMDKKGESFWEMTHFRYIGSGGGV